MPQLIVRKLLEPVPPLSRVPFVVDHHLPKPDDDGSDTDQASTEQDHHVAPAGGAFVRFNLGDGVAGHLSGPDDDIGRRRLVHDAGSDEEPVSKSIVVALSDVKQSTRLQAGAYDAYCEG